MEYFNASILPRLPGTSDSADYYTVDSVEVGASKDKLDAADLSLNVVEVTEQFGKFVKYYVIPESATNTGTRHVDVITVNAFDVLMTSQQEVCSFAVVAERNKKDKLYNDLIRQLAKEKCLTLRQDEMAFGVRILKCISRCSMVY